MVKLGSDDSFRVVSSLSLTRVPPGLVSQDPSCVATSSSTEYAGTTSACSSTRQRESSQLALAVLRARLGPRLWCRRSSPGARSRSSTRQHPPLCQRAQVWSRQGQVRHLRCESSSPSSPRARQQDVTRAIQRSAHLAGVSPIPTKHDCPGLARRSPLLSDLETKLVDAVKTSSVAVWSVRVRILSIDLVELTSVLCSLLGPRPLCLLRHPPLSSEQESRRRRRTHRSSRGP